jgi:hypothetical protein
LPDPGTYNQKTEKIKVMIETSRYSIEGTVHPLAIAYRSRLSDLLNRKDISFLSVTDVKVFNPDNPDVPDYTAPYLAVNTEQIQTIRPLE